MLKVALRAFLLGCVFLHTVARGSDDSACFAARRAALMKKIGDSIAVLQGAPDTRSYTAFRQDNNFYYLTGVEAPNAFLLVDGIRHQSVLFLPPRDKELERWEGPRLHPASETAGRIGIELVLAGSQFEEELRKRSEPSKPLYAPLSPGETAASSRDRASQHELERQRNPWDGRISREAAFERNLLSKVNPASVKDLSPILDEMRRIKDAQEIERLREAGKIGALGLREAIRSARPGMHEYQVAAIARLVFMWHGASGEAFFPIVGSGPNSCLIHYNRNERRMESGDIVVMDYGPDYRYYTSDVSRTFPVSGKFTKEQAKAYQIVLDAQKAALGKIKPGAGFSDLDETVAEVLGRHGYGNFLNHAVSHYVGMSTHDVGKSGPFEAGVVITVEPGVYIPEKNLGIRIEDTVLVTQNGYEVLTRDAPKEIVEIEKLMAGRSISEALRD
jgi:Xaa-Pro aminopeptidase